MVQTCSSCFAETTHPINFKILPINALHLDLWSHGEFFFDNLKTKIMTRLLVAFWGCVLCNLNGRHFSIYPSKTTYPISFKFLKLNTFHLDLWSHHILNSLIKKLKLPHGLGGWALCNLNGTTTACIVSGETTQPISFKFLTINALHLVLLRRHIFNLLIKKRIFNFS